jgi:hypothetical protein
MILLLAVRSGILNYSALNGNAGKKSILVVVLSYHPVSQRQRGYRTVAQLDDDDYDSFANVVSVVIIP